MKIKDVLYGEFNITEPVIISLLKSKPLLRLKGIAQAGTGKYLKSWRNITRFDHSVGVMLLLRRFGAAIEEQVAGLLHDISHTAFSHVTDFVFVNQEHEYHEKHFTRFIKGTEIAFILRQYGFYIKRILNMHDFKLLEHPLPDLCADRIDYFLRDMESRDGFTNRIKQNLNALQTYKGMFIFNDLQKARQYSLDYLELDRTCWADPREVAAFYLLAESISLALKEGILRLDDLFTTDKQVMEKLKSSEKKEILDKVNLLNPQLAIVEDKKNYDFHLKTKVRFLDPKVLVKDKLAPLSYFDPRFALVLKAHEEKTRAGYYVRILKIK